MNLKVFNTIFIIYNVAANDIKNEFKNPFEDALVGHRICEGITGLNNWPVEFINWFGYTNMYKTYCVSY